MGEEHGEKRGGRRLVRHQQNETGKEQERQDAKFNIRSTLQEAVPLAEVLQEWHPNGEERGQDQYGTATPYATLAQTVSLLDVLTASLVAAAQTTPDFSRETAYKNHFMKRCPMSNTTPQNA